MSRQTRIIVIAGTNASGKSSLAIKLAKKIRGEIVSADSRQVYRGLDIGSGKVSMREQSQVPHHLLDVASPKRQYTVAHFVRDAKRIIHEIYERNRIPIICGGTGFWIDALIYGYTLPRVSPDAALRRRLEKKSTAQLIKILQSKDPGRLAAIDTHNRRRLIRAIEIVTALKRPIPRLTSFPQYDVLLIGITHPAKLLRKRISKRLNARMRQGMIAEVQRLHTQGVAWKRLDALGLEYRFVSKYLQGHIAKKEMLALLENAIYRYAKRQMTWFRKNPDVHWVHTQSQIHSLTKKFLKQY